MKNKRFNLNHFKKGRILRLEELKSCVKNQEPVWVYVKDYSKPKAKVDKAEFGLILNETTIKFISSLFDFKTIKDQNNCSLDLNKKSIIKIYKAIPTKNIRVNRKLAS